MLDYILQFYNNYTIIFYFLLILIAIIEWPIIVLALSLLSAKLWFSYIFLFFISFMWDFIWDMIHYFIWRFFSKKFENKKDFKIIENINKKLEKHSLFDKIIVIKYTPPITSIWLIYLWYKEKNVFNFMKNIVPVIWFNSFIITFVWFYFWYLFVDNENFSYFIMVFFLSLAILYLWTKFITKYLIKKIYNDKNT
jgi:hypothetical protein